MAGRIRPKAAPEKKDTTDVKGCRMRAMQAPVGSTGDVNVFLRGVTEVWRSARSHGREYLDWDEWKLWATAALRARLVTRAELVDPPERPDGGLWRVSILRTWRRVKRAKAEGLSAEQFHRDEIAASKHEAKAISTYSASTARRRV